MAKQIKKNPRGLGFQVYGNKDGFIPNWGGVPLTKLSDSGGGSSGLSHFQPRWQSPLLSWTNYYVPWDRATLYQWIRFYDTFHPIVPTCIDLHAQMPLSRFRLKDIADETILQFYEETMENMDAYDLMFDQMREYWLIGEMFCYLVWSEELGTFIDGEILPPEYVEVKGHPLVTGDVESSFEYYLQPDDSLIEFVTSSDETVEELKKHLPVAVIDAIQHNKMIKINPFNLMVMMRKQSRYNPRGTSIVLRCLKTLLYEDKIIEAQYAIADRLVMPTEIWKLGTEKYPPTRARLEGFAQLIRAMEDQPKRNLVTHFAVNYEIIGAVGKFPQLNTEFDWCEKRILTALFTNKAITTGEGPTYANASVAMRALLMRYIQVRNSLETSWKQNVFYPIALANKFYKVTQAELSHGVRRPFKDRELLVPEFDWHYKSNLLDDAAFKELLLRLRDKGLLPMKIVLEHLGIDYETAKDWLKKEEGTVYDEFHKLYREALIKKGIPPAEVPAYPGAPEQAAAAAASRKMTDQEKEEKQIQKGKPKDLKELVQDLPEIAGTQFMSRGGIKRKVRASSYLYRLRHSKDALGGEDKIGVGIEDNILHNDDAPPEALRMVPKRKIVFVNDKML